MEERRKKVTSKKLFKSQLLFICEDEVTNDTVQSR